MKLLQITIMIMCIGVSACATLNSTYAPTEAELAQADYGAKPANYKSVIKAYVHDALIDPESARFSDFSIPKKDWLSEFQGFGVKKYFGWLVCVNVNAKNQLGGYVGRKPYFFIMRGDEITFALTKGDTHKEIAYGAWKYPIQCQYN